MRAANQVVNTKLAYRTTSEIIISHKGTSNGTRAIITMGEVSGIIENQNTKSLCGFLNAAMAT
jgi:hypothetical protein